jgi:hypothetical protein
MLIKDISNIDLKLGTANLDYTMVVRFPQCIETDPNFNFKMEKFIIRINNEGTTFTNDDQRVTYRKRNDLIIYTIRNKCELKFKVSVRKIPFDIINIPVVLVLNEQRTEINKMPIDIIFNFHSCTDTSSNLSIKDNDGINDFSYCSQLHSSKLGYDNTKVVNSEDTFNSSSELSHNICLSRNPGNLLFTLLMPVYVLDLFILAIYG